MDTIGYVACPDCKGAVPILFGVAEGLTKLIFYARCMTCHVKGIPATIRVAMTFPKALIARAIEDGLPVKKVA